MNYPHCTTSSQNHPYRAANQVKETPRLQGKWLPPVAICLFYFSMWAPPPLSGFVNRWFILLGLALFAFMLQKAKLNMKAASFYWTFWGISFLGAVVSLLRAPSLDLALWNTVGSGIIFITLMLFIPILALNSTRRYLLFVLVGTALMWTFEIQRLVGTYGTLAYSTLAETGDNKNAVGYSLALAAVCLFYLAVFWKPARSINPTIAFMIKLFFGLGGVYLFYHQALIYAKGSMLATAAGILATLGVIYWRSSHKLTSVIRIVLISSVLVLMSITLWPKVLEISPSWNVMYMRVTTEGAASLSNSRNVLLEKGIYIITQNPIIGIGLGGSRASIETPYQNFSGLLIHNTYLTDWAEKGILGLFATFFWMIGCLKFMKQKFKNLGVVDQIWLVLFIPLMVQMLFKNISFEVFLVIITGIMYQQYFITKKDISASHRIPA
jgi:hypothetical protein